MGRLGPTEILLIAVVVMILFGRGKVANMMGEVGKGITAFKRGIAESGTEAPVAEAETDRHAAIGKDLA